MVLDHDKLAQRKANEKKFIQTIRSDPRLQSAFLAECLKSAGELIRGETDMKMPESIKKEFIDFMDEYYVVTGKSSDVIPTAHVCDKVLEVLGEFQFMAFPQFLKEDPKWSTLIHSVYRKGQEYKVMKGVRMKN